MGNAAPGGRTMIDRTWWSETFDLTRATLRSHLTLAVPLLLLTVLPLLPADELYIRLAADGRLDPSSVWTVSDLASWSGRYSTSVEAALLAGQLFAVLLAASFVTLTLQGVRWRSIAGPLARNVLSARRLVKTFLALLAMRAVVGAADAARTALADLPSPGGPALAGSVSGLTLLLGALVAFYVVGLAYEPARSRSLQETWMVLRFDGVRFTFLAAAGLAVGWAAAAGLSLLSELAPYYLPVDRAVAGGLVGLIEPVLATLWLYPLAGHVRSSWSA